MNDMQRQMIQQMRQSGCSFAQIAAAVELPKSTIKSFCYRLTGTDTAVVQQPVVKVCPQCGNAMTVGEHKNQRFCSTACRTRYWATHANEIVRGSAVELTCPVCHKPFQDYAQRSRKYCSHACYIAARYYGGLADDK